MQFEVNVSDVAGITLQLRSYSQVIHAANVRLPCSYDLNYLRAKAELASEDVAIAWSSSLYSEWKNLANEMFRPGPRWDLLRQEVRRGGQINGKLPYEIQGQIYVKDLLYDIENKSQTISLHSMDAGIEQLLHGGKVQYESLINQSLSVLSAQRIGEARRKGLQVQYDWHSANREFSRQRTAVTRRFANLKMNAATLPDGILNHSKRLPGLRSQFEQDVCVAVSKLSAAHKGLRELFGFEHALPDLSLPNAFEELIKWTRTVIQWLIANSQRDRSVACTISLRELVGERGWVEGAVAREWRFNIAEDFFGDSLTTIRLRGLSVVTVARSDIRRKCDSPPRLYRFSMTPPITAVTRHSSGDARNVDQSCLAPLIIGRVTDRWTPRSPDIVGNNYIQNASPIGDWKITLDGAVPRAGHEADLLVDLADIQIDLHFVYQTK
jgi:hypothetical protein